jgi:hypothetical protein
MNSEEKPGASENENDLIFMNGWGAAMNWAKTMACFAL